MPPMTDATSGGESAEGTRGDLIWGTTPRLVRQAALAFAGRPAVVDGDLTLSYDDLAEAVHQAARAFIAAGLEPGDRAAIWAPNISEWIVAALGLHSAGGVLVPLNTRFKGHEAGDILERSGARLLFTVTDFLDTDYVVLLRDALGGPGGGRPVAALPGLEQIVVLRGAIARRLRVVGGLPARRVTPRRPRRPTSGRWPSSPTTCPTSCSPPAPPARPRA